MAEPIDWAVDQGVVVAPSTWAIVVEVVDWALFVEVVAIVAVEIAVVVHNTCSEEEPDGTWVPHHRLDSSLPLFVRQAEAVLVARNTFHRDHNDSDETEDTKAFESDAADQECPGNDDDCGIEQVEAINDETA